MRALGAEIVEHGRDYDDAREHAERLAADDGYRYIHSGNEPHLVAGVATSTLEILEDLPDAEVLIVPIGGGSGAAAACIVAAARAPDLRVVGVQSAQAPAAYRSWREGRMVEDRMGTYAEGLATRTAFEFPQRILREHLHEFLLVDDDDIRRAQVAMIERTRNLVEAAGAAPLAAVLTHPGRVPRHTGCRRLLRWERQPRAAARPAVDGASSSVLSAATRPRHQRLHLVGRVGVGQAGVFDGDLAPVIRSRG